MVWWFAISVSIKATLLVVHESSRRKVFYNLQNHSQFRTTPCVIFGQGGEIVVVVVLTAPYPSSSLKTRSKISKLQPPDLVNQGSGNPVDEQFVCTRSVCARFLGRIHFKDLFAFLAACGKP